MPEKKKSVVPRLRFPEFRDAGEWVVKQLGEICQMTAGEFVAASRIKEATADNLYPCYGGNGLRGFTETFTHEGIYPLIGRQGALCGNITLATGKFHATEHAVVVAPRKNTVTNWLYYQLVRLNLNQFATGQAQPGLSVANLNGVPVAIPQEEDEQQKIADCLSSLDEVIDLEAQKLDALKGHKKGLMQQLFPREGETTPRLRFPEFRNAGKWEVERLGELLVGPPEYGINAPAVPYSECLPTYLRITDIAGDGSGIREEKVSVAINVSKENYLCEGDIVLARTGASVGKSYKYKKENGPLVFAGFLIRIRPNKDKLNDEFLYQYFFTEQYWRWVSHTSARSGQPGINRSEYASLPLPMPLLPPEQQKIADCLASLDEVINLQNQKLDALKAHKKGLMQQLFPQEVD